MHFKLYEGYVTNTNLLNTQIAELIGGGELDAGPKPRHSSELRRRYGFEYNGMVLHEYYFDNMKKTAAPAIRARSFGSLQKPRKRVSAATMFGRPILSPQVKCVVSAGLRPIMRPSNGRISNHWINLHETGNVAGYTPILIMDVWEHAFMLE